MMEHVRHFDWCASIPERYFVEEADIDNCNTEKILKNRFFDPMLSSDSEDDDTPNRINWDEIFKHKLNFKPKLFVPCLRPVPPYPKVSAFTIQQHNQFLKILSAENPRVLSDLFVGKPTRQDNKAFEASKETYLKEQKEYIAWAKILWTTDHCIRALRPKPAIETVYEAEFKIRAQRMRGLPKQYDVAAQIPLESRRNNCEFVMKQELIGVSLADMPQADWPDKIEKQLTIIRPCTVPEPCQKHPYQFILPNEDTVSILPITEIHRELALYALAHGAQYVASENALKCLLQHDRHWSIPLSVCETIGPDGDKENVVVLDSEFAVHKESAPVRTLKAFRHLLEVAFIPSSEKEKIRQRRQNSSKKKEFSSPAKLRKSSFMEDDDISSDDEDAGLFIDTGNDEHIEPETEPPSNKKQKTEDKDNKTEINKSNLSSPGYNTRAVTRRLSEEVNDIGVYNCTCKDTLYERPPRRSFKKWQFKNKSNDESFDIIIHCPHKARSKTGELLLEPIPEYQLDLGASQQSEDSIRSVALSLALRKNAAVLNVRVDGPTGDVATFSTLSGEQWGARHPGARAALAGTVHTALSQLQGLLPGNYVLLHEPSHGANALLLSPQPNGIRHKLVLNFDCSQLAEADEAKMVKTPPTITDELLPYHKYRRVLPCAFTPYENQLMKETNKKKPAPKKKPPPQAIKWPKRKSRRKNK